MKLPRDRAASLLPPPTAAFAAMQDCFGMKLLRFLHLLLLPPPSPQPLDCHSACRTASG